MATRKPAAAKTKVAKGPPKFVGVAFFNNQCNEGRFMAAGDVEETVAKTLGAEMGEYSRRNYNIRGVVYALAGEVKMPKAPIEYIKVGEVE